jgi:hypothetical protein
MPDHASPLAAAPEARRENLAAMHSRIAGAMARVAADPRQPKAVRAANARDAAAARRAASTLSR